MGILLGIVLLLAAGVGAVLVVAQLRLNRGIEEVERNWQAHQPDALGDFGSTESLSLLPLVDNNVSSVRVHVRKPEQG